MRLDERFLAPFNFKYGTKGDIRPVRLSISFCDDNDGFHGALDVDTLKGEIEKAVRMTVDGSRWQSIMLKAKE